MSSSTDEISNQDRRNFPFKFFQIVFLIAFTLLPVYFGAVHIWVVALFSGTVALSFGVYFITLILYKKPVVIRSALYPWILIYLFFLIPASFHSLLPARLPLEFLKLSAVILAFVASLYYFRERKDIERLCLSVVWVGTGLSLFGLLQYLGGFSKDWWTFPNFLSANYVNHNHFANLLEMIIPVSLALAVLERDGGKKMLLWFFCGVMLLAFILSLSRGGYLAMTLGLGLMAVLLWRRGLILVAWTWILLLIFVVALGIYFFSPEAVTERLATLNTADVYENYSQRIYIWRGAFELIRHYFWLGTGPGTFDVAFLKFRPLEFLHWRPFYAHNDFLNLLSDCGVLVFLSTGAIIFIVFKRAFFIVGDSEDPFKIILAAAVSAGLLAYLAHSSVDFNFHISANFIYLAVFTGALFSLRGSDSYRNLFWDIPIRILTAILIVISLAAAIFVGLSDYNFYLARRAFARQDYGETEKLLNTSLRFNPLKDEAYFYRAQSRARIKKPKEALEDYDSAIRFNPLEPYYEFEKANVALSSQSKTLDQAVLLYESALSKDVMDPLLYYLSGRAVFLEGLRSKNRTYEAKAMTWMKTATHYNDKYLKNIYELLWRDGRSIRKLEAFMPVTASSAHYMLEFLESKGLWTAHRKYYLISQKLSDNQGLATFNKLSWESDPGGRYILSNFSVKGQGTVYSGETFFTNGEIQKEINFKQELSRISIYGWGTAAFKAYPYLIVTLDDKPVDAVYINSDTEKYFYVIIKAKPGKHILGFRYVNDRKDPARRQDRDIHLKRVEIQYPRWK